jgi:hypothetical protein
MRRRSASAAATLRPKQPGSSPSSRSGRLATASTFWPQFVKELPMTGVGKVDKKVLKARFWAGRERMVG